MNEAFPYPKLTKQLTVAELEDIREAVLSLDEALKQIPQQFDFSFKEKIHRVLDITSELEHHTRQLRNEVEHSQKAFNTNIDTRLKEFHQSLLEQIDSTHQQQNDSIKDNLVKAIVRLRAISILSGILVSLVTGASIGATFYWLVVS